MMPWRLARKVRENREFAEALEQRLDRVENHWTAVNGALAKRLDGVESALRDLQSALEGLHTDRLSGLDDRLDRLESGLGQSGEEIVRLRDGVMPASEGRWNALFERLVFDLGETASLVERMLASEPLPVPRTGAEEAAIADGLARVQPLLAEAFRGSEAVIAHRMEALLPLVKDRAPVLDLGCGRGELLVLLREAGIEARGIERDEALVQGAIRRGLRVTAGEILTILKSLETASVGAVTAIHVFEHLGGAALAAVLEECRRVIRPGGRLIAECPNPHNLRVGAALFWQDPTHVRPLLPETLVLFLKAAGFPSAEIEPVHPFPPDQQWSDSTEPGSGDGDLARRIHRLEHRLDDVLNGPRDFRLSAERSA